MMLGSFFFKNKAKRILKGQWQTALLVTFFAALFLTASQVAQTVNLRDVRAALSSLSYAMQTMPETISLESAEYQELQQLTGHFINAVQSVPTATLVMLLALNGLALVVSPLLTVGCNRYFIGLVDGQDMQVHEALLCRVRSWHRILWLYVIIFVKILLWSLLFLIPGIIAAIRYSMAPYYLAEDPSLKAREALRKSKETMKGQKMTYFMLSLSFVGWNLLVTAVQMFLVDLSPIVSLVAAQFLSLAVSVYMNASIAVFYTAVSRPGGTENLVRETNALFRRMGMEDVHFPEEDEKPESEDGGDSE